MSKFRLSQVRITPQLDSILMAYQNEDFVVDQVLPECPVVLDSATIKAISNDHFRKFRSTRSVNDITGHKMEFTYTDAGTYLIQQHDLEVDVPDQIQDNCEKPIDVVRDAGLIVGHALKVEREAAIAEALTNTAVLTQNATLSGSSQFNDKVNSEPDTVVTTAINTIKSATAKKPNSMVIEERVFNALRLHPYFTGQVTGIKILGREMMIELIKSSFDLKNVYVAGALYESAEEGQTSALTSIWGKSIVLFYKPDAPGIMQTSLGYSFRQKGKMLNTKIRRHQDDNADIVKVIDNYDDMIVNAACGYLIKDAIA